MTASLPLRCTMVSVSVASVNCAKTTEPIELLLGVWIRVANDTTCYGAWISRLPAWKRQVVGGHI